MMQKDLLPSDQAFKKTNTTVFILPVVSLLPGMCGTLPLSDNSESSADVEALDRWCKKILLFSVDPGMV